MKILIQTLYPAPYRVSLYELLAQQHDIVVFFEKDNDNRNPLYCTYSNKFTYFLLGSKEADEAYQNAMDNIKQYDFVMLYEYHTILSAKLILNCILHRVNYAINCDGAVEISHKFPRKQIKTFFIKHAALCLAGGNKAKEYFKTYGANDEKIYIHNFTSIYESDIAPFISSEDRQRKRKAKGIAGETASVSVGRLIKSKQFDLLIEIWRHIPKQHHLYIVGSGELKHDLEKLIDDYKLENVHIMDFMVRNQLFEFYSVCDSFVFTTERDIWGLVINEAMAKGVPVISNNKCSAAVDMVVDGENGYVIDDEVDTQKYIELFSEKVKLVLENKEMWNDMSKNSVIKASDYTYEHMARIVLSALEGINGNRE